MNYFELHIGDLTEATAHLTILEDGVYGRLMRKYYATEKPLPADLKTLQRLIGARSKDEREAVETVLRDFFELQDDGWHQSRCDAEIAAYHEKMAGKEAGKEGAKERQRRARERRKSLFEQLRGHGQVPSFSTTTADLELMLSRVTSGDASRGVTQPVTRDDTATQTPDTKHQTPVLPADAGIASATPGLAAKAMKGAGLGDVNPSHPKLAALLAGGITLDELRDAAATAVQGGKGFAYALATAEGRRIDAAKVGTLPQQTGPTETQYQRSMREKVAEWAPTLAKRPPGPPATPPNTIEAEVRDVTPRRLG